MAPSIPITVPATVDTPSPSKLLPIYNCEHESFDELACHEAVKKAQPIIETARMTLDPPAPKDDPALRGMLSDIETMADLLFMTKYPTGWTLDEIKGRRQRQWKGILNKDRLSYYIHSKATGEFMGIVGAVVLNLENKNAHFGVGFLKKFWKGGYATEAQYALLRHLFEDLKLHKVTYETVESNVGMRRFLEEICGVKLAYVNKDEDLCSVTGKYVSLWVYSIFEEDWPRIRVTLLERIQQGATKAKALSQAAETQGTQQVVEP